MRHVIVGLGLLALGAGGCATSQQLELEAREHDAKAVAAASIRDYNAAAKEKKKAEKLHRKAVEESLDEGTAGTVVVPTAPTNP